MTTRAATAAARIAELEERCNDQLNTIRHYRVQEQEGGALVAARMRIDQLARQVLDREATIDAQLQLLLQLRVALRTGNEERARFLPIEAGLRARLTASQQRTAELERTLVSIRDQAIALEAELVELSRVLEARR